MYTIVKSASTRADVAHGLLVTVAAGVVAVSFLMHHKGGWVDVPVAVPPPPNGGDHRMVIPGDSHGACYTAARIDGVWFPRNLLDSGAGNFVTLGRNHAAQIGIDPKKLVFDHSYGSANGIGREAIIKLREFQIGSYVIRDVTAAITEASQDEPLIGSPILHPLNFTMRGGFCELRWKK